MSSGFIVPKLRSFVCSWGFWPEWTIKWFHATQGPFTIFFWCPFAKWLISLTNIHQMVDNPIEQVNSLQQAVIMLSGTLFARWAFLVTPVNVYLSLCNCVMASTGAIQLYRKYNAGQLF